MGSAHLQTIVVGAGAIGSAAAYWLAERGQTDVLVLEQYELGHAHGASEDHSRIIRHSYHDSVYGRLTRPAYDNWARLQDRSGQQLVFETGGLDIAVEGTPGVQGVENYRRTLTENGHPWEALDTAGLLERFPQFRIDEDVRATYQHETGLLDVRRSRQTHVALAEGAGVTFLERTPVRRLESYAHGVRVFTDEGVHTADHVVVATASWADDLLRDLGQTWTTTISQEQVAYFATPHVKDFSIGRFPVWVWHDEMMFYGFPVYGEVAIKVSRDVTGNFVTQQTRTREPIPAETDLLADFVRDRLPTGIGRELYSKTCVYDMPPDRDFVVDALPGHPRIVLGLGAGHAAKFSGLLGEVLAELVVDGRSSHPIGSFRADRPALTDPAFVPAFLLRG
ncbi:N-methyl-L-tryptophan oxidase [Kineococcus sp. GCM10028916]|uniref:N-methyl-L-tryptophan oxidase n=1 Tax=Kineococcus sp. GCM10028916 TaxID=3273394 RepID=UPI00363DC0F2